MKAFIVFLSDNIFNFEAKEANFFFLKQKSREFKRFLPPKPEMKAFTAFLSDNIFNFEAKKAKKNFLEAKIQRI